MMFQRITSLFLLVSTTFLVVVVQHQSVSEATDPPAAATTSTGVSPLPFAAVKITGGPPDGKIAVGKTFPIHCNFTAQSDWERSITFYFDDVVLGEYVRK